MSCIALSLKLHWPKLTCSHCNGGSEMHSFGETLSHLKTNLGFLYQGRKKMIIGLATSSLVSTILLLKELEKVEERIQGKNV